MISKYINKTLFDKNLTKTEFFKLVVRNEMTNFNSKCCLSFLKTNKFTNKINLNKLEIFD